MIVLLTNLKVSLVGEATAAERKFLRATLSFEDKTARFTGAAQSQLSLFNVVTNTFPAGLLSLVMRTAAKSSPPVRIEYADKRARPCEADREYDATFLPEFQPHGSRPLRGYQHDAVRAVWERTRGVLQLPTGAGKTTIAVAIVRSLATRWLFVVDAYHLVTDAANRYREMTGEECGVIGDSEWSTGRVTFATFQTLSARIDRPEVKEFLASVRGVIVDECHTVAADTFWNVMQALPHAYYRVGLSGTPLSRTDSKSILVTAALGSVIYKITPGELTALGYLAMPKITMLEVEQVGGWNMHYSRFRTLTVVKSPRRNAAVMEAIERVAKPALVFIKEIDHGRFLLKQVHERTGLRAKLVHGEHEVPVRKQAVAALERRDIDFIICSSVFTKGIDIPFLEGGVNAAGGESEIDAIQRLGRGLRVTATKTTFDWIDIADTGHVWLARHTDSRKQAYIEAGYTPIREVSLAALKVVDVPIVSGKPKKNGITSAEQVTWASAEDIDDV